MKATVLLISIFALSLPVLAFRANSSAKTKRDEVLFLAGSKAISERHFDEGRVLLNTMINTYPESLLREQARLLVFYSYAREGKSEDEKAAMLLKEIEELMETYRVKSRFP